MIIAAIAKHALRIASATTTLRIVLNSGTPLSRQAFRPFGRAPVSTEEPAPAAAGRYASIEAVTAELY
jgi:hypothetical protein